MIQELGAVMQFTYVTYKGCLIMDIGGNLYERNGITGSLQYHKDKIDQTLLLIASNMAKSLEDDQLGRTLQ